MSTVRLPIPGDPPSHLAVRLARPERPVDSRLCVLYCHGFASSQEGEKADFFRHHFLEAGLAMCSFDFQGHGESGGDMVGLTLSRCLRDVAAVHAYLRGEGFERLIFFGSSMGGGVASWYASQSPASVACAFHIAPALEMDEGLLRLVGAEKAQTWRERGSVLFEHELGDHELSWRLIEDLRDYPRSRLARAYRTPTLIFQGAQDSSVSWRVVSEFAASCDGAVHVHLMADGDHRLVDRLPFLWQLTSAFLAARGLVSGGSNVHRDH